MTVILWITAYFLLLNLSGLILMGVDKRRAVKGAFRIPEATLFIVAFIGGSAGCLAGMYLFRHKTRKWYFVYGMPAILLLQAAALFLLFFYAPVELLTM